MPIPTYSPGQVLGASDVNNWLVPQVAVKPAATSRASTITRTADPDLVLPLTVNATYDFEAYLAHTGAHSPGDIDFAFSGPAGYAMTFQCAHNEGGSIGLSNSILGYDQTSVIQSGNGATTSEVRVAVMKGIVTTGTTAGNLSLLWAQDSSTATATILRANSVLKLRRIG